MNINEKEPNSPTRDRFILPSMFVNPATSSILPSICKPLLSKITHKLSNLFLLAAIDASHICPSSISPSPSKQYILQPSLSIFDAIEGKAEWHGKAPKAEEYEKAIEELKGRE